MTIYPSGSNIQRIQTINSQIKFINMHYSFEVFNAKSIICKSYMAIASNLEICFQIQIFDELSYSYIVIKNYYIDIKYDIKNGKTNKC